MSLYEHETLGEYMIEWPNATEFKPTTSISVRQWPVWPFYII